MIKVLLAHAIVASAIAAGVKWMTDESTSQGPTVVTVEVPNPMGGSQSGGGGDKIYVP